MYVLLAYIFVVLTWSTTPLAIIWSSETVNPVLAAFLRMLIAAILGLLVLIVARIPLHWQKDNFRLYAYSLLGVYGSMLCSYMAARYIPSGLMSLLFGLSPIVSGLIAQRLLNEPKFGPIRWCAIVLSLTGLAFICADSLYLGTNGWLGIVLIIIAVLLFSVSAVLVKRVQVKQHPLATTVGTLLLSLPLYGLTWFLADGTLPANVWSERSLWSILYLGVFGSLLGFVAYFYILARLAASTVTLVTLITPMMAIFLGSQLNQEPITQHLLMGASLVLVGLAIYCFHRIIRQWLNKLRQGRLPGQL